MNFVKTYITYQIKKIQNTNKSNKNNDTLPQNIEKTLNDYDIFKFDKGYYFRGYAKCYKQIEHDKPLNGFKISDECFKEHSPISIFPTLTNVQKTIIADIPKLKKFGTILYKAPCGAGKTKAGLEIIHALRLKTLVISCRNAVNDQWKKEFENEFLNLNISTKMNDISSDIYIFTPQYIIKKDISFFKNLHVDLIIYDEIHSLTSTEFSKVLSLPFKLSMKYDIKLPILIGLTASLPVDKKSNELFKTIFGLPKIIKNESITQIPIYFYDHRDIVPKRGKYDENYHKPSEKEIIPTFLNWYMDNNFLPSIDYKLILITDTIESSIFGAIQASIKFQTDVLIIRSAKENDIKILKDHIPQWYYLEENDEFKPSFKLEDLLEDGKNEGFIKLCKYQDELSTVSIISGTIDRLKEGFNCENIVYGICSSFIWSIPSRIQLLGRIRRNTKNEQLQKHKRIFLVCSSKIPNDMIHVKMNHIPKKPEVLYDLELESKLFKEENYIKIKTLDELVKC